MDRTQVAAGLAGLALVGASLVGAVVVTQGSGDVSLADTPVTQPEAIAVSASPSTVMYAATEMASGDAVGLYDEDTAAEAGGHEYEHDEYDEYEGDEYEDDEYEDYEEDDEDDD